MGVIGTGSMGQNHARVLSDMGNLIGIFDTNSEVCSKLASRFKTTSYDSIDQLLAASPEAISIVTPTNTHYDITRTVLESDVNVLLEKPATGDPVKLLELAKLAESRKLTLAVGLIERHNPVVSFTRKNLESGNFGSLISAHARRVSSFPLRIRDVGVIMDLGIHDIDIIRYLARSKVKRVFATAGKFKNKEYEDHANIVIEFANGISGTVEVNWLTPNKVRGLTLTCSDQFVELDYISQSVDLCSSSLREFDPGNLFDLALEFQSRQINLKKEEPLRRELQDFMDAYEKGSPPLVTAKDAAETIRVAHASIESARTNHAVDL